MKIRMSVPAMCRANCENGYDGERMWIFTSFDHEFDIRETSEGDMPVEIEMVNATRRRTKIVRYDTEHGRLMKAATTQARINQIDQPGSYVGFAGEHPLAHMIEIANDFIRRKNEANYYNDLHSGCGWRPIPASEYGAGELDRRDVASAIAVAEESLRDYRFLAGKLWKPMPEPLLMALKGRPNWTIYLDEDNRHDGEVPHLFGLNRFDEARETLAGFCADGDVADEIEIAVAGRFDYARDGYHVSAKRMAHRVCGYMAVLISERGKTPTGYRTDRQSIRMLESHLTLRRLADAPEEAITDEMVSNAYEAIAALREEAKAAGLTVPIPNQKAFEAHRHRWENRPVTVADGMGLFPGGI